ANTITGSGFGIYAKGSDAVIHKNIVTSNGVGIFADNNSAIISGNHATGNFMGIRSRGEENQILTNTVANNLDTGIYVQGNGTIINENIVSNNTNNGIAIQDSDNRVSITGNTITNNTGTGLYITDNGGDGDGVIYNNYFANDQNVCATTSSASLYDWTIPSGPTKGTNLMGGPYLAGNYWSNPSGTGWSDQQNATTTGYSLTPYEIVTGVNDTAPLVGVIPSPGGGGFGGSESVWEEDTEDEIVNNSTGSPPDEEANLSSLLPIHIILTGASFASPGTPGTTGTIALTLRNTGTTVLPPQARISLTPENVLARTVGELNTTSRPGGEFVTSFPLKIPKNPGEYLFVFQPEEVTTNVTSGEPIRVTAGYLNRFTVTIPPSGDAGVGVS
ncbi:MAG: right-handed parallel beta-helix repeat-containing protein, partial [Methanospirillum sp.]|nr:right-handed parallel beta-helix repeat-containing protein [Methanospirillum sp.]